MSLTSMFLGPGYPVLKRVTSGSGTAEAAYAIFGPVFYQCLIVYILDCMGATDCKPMGLGSYYGGSWLSILVYRLLVIFLVFMKEPKSRSFYFLFFLRTGLSVGISAYLSHAVLANDVSKLLPATEDVVFQFWTLFAIVLLGFFSTRRDREEVNYEALFYEVDNIARDRYPERFKQDHVLRALYCAIGMIEAYYRPKPFRVLERALFFLPCVKTTGIMQVKSKKALSDEESVEIAFSLVERCWDEFLIAKWKQAEVVAGELAGAAGDDGLATEEVERLFRLSDSGYSYRLKEMKSLVADNFSSLHLRYMGTSKFDSGRVFFYEAFECIDKQEFQPGNIVIEVDSSALVELKKGRPSVDSGSR